MYMQNTNQVDMLDYNLRTQYSLYQLYKQSNLQMEKESNKKKSNYY